MDRIDADLLMRYHKNECSDKEMLLVEAWLRGEVSYEQPNEIKLNERKEAIIGGEIWSAVESTMYANKRITFIPLLKKISRYAAVILLPLHLFWSISEHTDLGYRVVTLDNYESIHSRKYSFPDVEVELGANSQCRLYTNLLGEVQKVDFDGAVSVKNLTAKASVISVVSPAGNCEQLPLKDKVSLQSGESYMALVNAACHIVAATDRELREGLPIGVKLEIQKHFTL